MRPIIADIAVSLWRLLPANPIVLRVVHGGSKRMPHFWARTGYLLVILFVMLATQWSQKPGESLGEQAKASARVFEIISMLQLAMMCFLAPIFTAGAISQEKDAETFNVLLTTPLTNAQIVLGALMSRLFFVIMLLLAGLPLFCVTMIYGGVTSEQILLSFGIAGCTAVVTGSLAIMISIMRVGTRGTIFSFYAGIAIYLFAVMALGLWSRTYVPASVPPGGGNGMSFLAPFHPFLAQMVALKWTPPPDAAAVAHYGWPWNRMLASPHTSYMWLTLIASLGMVAVATFFVRRGAKQGELTWWTRAWRRSFATTVDGERKRRSRRVWSNPVAWREAATRGSVGSSNLARYGYLLAGIVTAILFLIAYDTNTFGPPTRTPSGILRSPASDWLSMIVVVEFVTVLMMAVNTAATSITRERESGTMELLLTTPLTSRDIVWGKLRGLVSFTVPLMAVPAATVLVLAVHDLIAGTDPPVVPILSAILLPPLLLVYSSLACMLGLQMSLKTTRSVQAVLTSVGILLVVGFGLGLCALAVTRAPGPIGPVSAPLTFVTAVWMAVNPRFMLGEMPSSIGMSIEEAQGWLLVGTLIAVGLYGAIAAAIYKSMIRDFDMIVRKQSR